MVVLNSATPYTASYPRYTMLSYYHRLFAYNEWANRRIFQSVHPVPAEDFTRDLGSSFPSIRDTLVHILGAEWIWLRRWKGISPKSLPGSDEIASLEDIRHRLDDVELERRAFLHDLTNHELNRSIRYANTKGEEWEYPLWEMLSHVVNHSTYHRGQVATMLRQLGHRPISTDMIYFKDEENA